MHNETYDSTCNTNIFNGVMYVLKMFLCDFSSMKVLLYHKDKQHVIMGLFQSYGACWGSFSLLNPGMSLRVAHVLLSFTGTQRSTYRDQGHLSNGCHHFYYLNKPEQGLISAFGLFLFPGPWCWLDVMSNNNDALNSL